jgi:hypothetical protein
MDSLLSDNSSLQSKVMAKIYASKKKWRSLLYLVGIIFSIPVLGQNPTTCASVGSRANSNGQSTSCPSNGAATASNFTGTLYATLPTGSSKTGNLTLTYAGANTGLLPYAITKVWLTTTGTTVTGVQFGPAAVPVINGTNTDVKYCFYGSNLATIGTLSFELTNPQTGVVWGICSYDASCNSACTVVSNPAGVLPVTYSYFKIEAQSAGFIQLGWATTQEQNNKGFFIERSTGDSAFTAIGFVPSANNNGNSSIPTNYSYVDANVPDVPVVSYRVRQQDLDGRSHYTGVLVAQWTQFLMDIKIYTDGNALKIDFPRSYGSKRYDILVYDSQGKLFLHSQVLAASNMLIANLPGSQLFYVSVKDSEGTRKSVKSIFVR